MLNLLQIGILCCQNILIDAKIIINSAVLRTTSMMKCDFGEVWRSSWILKKPSGWRVANQPKCHPTSKKNKKPNCFQIDTAGIPAEPPNNHYKRKYTPGFRKRKVVFIFSEILSKMYGKINDLPLDC